ncbi:MAG: hypothetical protein COA79_01725 [Planctomycetota bacterium]|nr:MAG: hypothetical protein COA79_01725 [Planctomycetota bacterium]
MTIYELPSSPAGRKSYKSLKHLIKTQISAGDLKAHDRLPSMRNLCDRYQISLATVQRALAELCKESFLYSQLGSGTFVAPIRKECKKIGILCGMSVDMMSKSMFNSLLQTIQFNALKDEKSITLFHLRKKHRGQFYYVDEQDIIRHEVDVLILVNILNLGLIASLKQIGIPIIATDIDASDVGVHSTYFDNELSAFDLTKKLIDEGHKNIWFMGGVEPTHVNYDLCLRQRYTGYRLACRSAGIKPGVDLYLTSFDTDLNLKERFVKAMEQNEHPTAIVTEYVDDVHEICKDLGLEKVDIVGWAPENQLEGRLDFAKYIAKCDFKELGELSYDILRSIDKGVGDSLITQICHSEILSK